jgi:hypothetical protein
MNTIISFIARHIRGESPALLGRWKIDYCSKKINDKIELANVDHCGTCGNYLIKKNENNTIPQAINLKINPKE